jgi:hypothetical protein
MHEQSGELASSVGRIFFQQPERLAAAWRRALLTTRHANASCQLLDCLVESFVQEIGLMLTGKAGSPWTRTTGVLRVSQTRGSRGLYEEFSALRRCLEDALDVLNGTHADRLCVQGAVDEALDSAIALHQLTVDPTAERPQLPFGGLVVELFERDDTNAVALAAVPSAVH